ncbi:unnamed protein product [Boreogadus saida]
MRCPQGGHIAPRRQGVRIVGDGDKHGARDSNRVHKPTVERLENIRTLAWECGRRRAKGNHSILFPARPEDRRAWRATQPKLQSESAPPP